MFTTSKPLSDDLKNFENLARGLSHGVLLHHVYSHANDQINNGAAVSSKPQTEHVKSNHPKKLGQHLFICLLYLRLVLGYIFGKLFFFFIILLI
uniref:Uncharacterized protein n=1 Tax=Panagrolaimus sp. JU765 TaxID=591449 RepID=A0AC34Q6D0_9BILA